MEIEIVKHLSKEEALNIVSDKVADYSKEIYMFVPLDGAQPVAMYTWLRRGIPSNHYLGLELKLKYSGGLYVYQPESKQLDITQHKWSDYQIYGVRVDDDCLLIDDNNYDISTISINKKDSIAIAKHFKLTAEDLK